MGYVPITRLYLDQDLKAGQVISLDRDQSHYLITVMRKGLDDTLALFNGRDGEWLATVIDANRKKAIIELTELRRPQTTEPNVTLAFAPVKSVRVDFIAQKACELGVSRLAPVITQRTNVARVRTDRLLANAIEAAEQSERLTIPSIAEPQKLADWLNTLDGTHRILFCDEDLSGKPAPEALAGLPRDHAWSVLIGPEGGFSDKERKDILAHPGSVAVTLGPRILRADTAALAALTLWQTMLGDW